MSYQLSHIASVIGTLEMQGPDRSFELLLIDSRKVVNAGGSLFFALVTNRRDGHAYISDLYTTGVRSFVVSKTQNQSLYPDASFLIVSDTLEALQSLAAYHRKQFSIPVIGITGSNGKTIVKEWLYQLLHVQQSIVRNPKSFNSQVGVPLSIWQMNATHKMGIFEAGISEPGEMEKLEKVIQPAIGVLTNIGDAHSEGFSNREEKLREKAILFRNCSLVVTNDETNLPQTLLKSGCRKVAWGFSTDSEVRVEKISRNERSTQVSINAGGNKTDIIVPFIDDASVHNALTCFTVLYVMGVPLSQIIEGISMLVPVNMRLELKKGIHNSSIINDSYSADLNSLDIALNFMDQQSGKGNRTVILSDFLQSALPDSELYTRIVRRLRDHNVARLIGIGPRISTALHDTIKIIESGIAVETFLSTTDFLQQLRPHQYRDEILLIKGARAFAFEQIVQTLEQKVHQTVLEINLNAIAHNVAAFRKILKPGTRIMAMVKAFAYGSGGSEIASVLQFQRIDYLGVAYADEGVELRRAGISLPIMVMNPEPSAFDVIVENNLEPELYTFGLLNAFDKYLQNQGLNEYPVHIEVETGMNRLGFGRKDISQLATALRSSTSMKVQTVFSHLAASEEAEQDVFTMEQSALFKQAADELENSLDYSILRHLSNTAAAVRHTDLQFDMVRLGIGLYGVNTAGSIKPRLLPVASFKSTLAQVKLVPAGESISYNRRAIVEKDSIIGTVRVGYADGYPRRLGNGIGQVIVKGHRAPVIGTVCMDMFMVDLTAIPEAREGDEVILFGDRLPIEELATRAETIPYDIMTGISQRVKRVYFEE